MKLIAPTKDQTTLLPPFAGLPIEHIHVPASAADFEVARAAIRAAGTVGFDTESKPTFSVGELSDGPHVVQFALQRCAYIFQLHHAAGLDVLKDILASAAVRKVGFGLQSDHAQIRAKLGVSMAGVLDLNTHFRRIGYGSSMGVRAAVGVVLQQGFHKSKKTTTTNWALSALSVKQLLYAANDAYAALKVMQALESAGHAHLD